MRKLGLAVALAATVSLAGCATQPYGNAQTGNVVGGAALGAATGAVAGAILPGIKPGTGAIAGAILGGVLGASVNGRQYYRDTRGYCYYVDQYGQPHYSYDIRC